MSQDNLSTVGVPQLYMKWSSANFLCRYVSMDLQLHTLMFRALEHPNILPISYELPSGIEWCQKSLCAGVDAQLPSLQSPVLTQ